MGFMGLLKFALLCFDLLAWPVFALGYPMYASMRAIETGSKYHMRKWVIYWTLFSIIYLFELAFVKFIEWVPFWSRIKLIATLLLVMPGFDGACHAYQSLIHPCLIVNLQGVIIDQFYKPKEEKPCKTENFLDVAEKYIKDNGFEALEKLIASKRETRVVKAVEKNAAATSKQLLGKETIASVVLASIIFGTLSQHKEPDASQKDKEILEATEKSASTEAKQVKSSQRETRVVEAVEKNAAATSNQLKESDAAQKDKQMLEATEKSASTEAKQVQQLSDNVAWVQKETGAAAEIKEMTPLETSAENGRAEIPPLEKVQREWTCALCQVTTTNEKTLNAHLQGNKHKSECESLKTSKHATGKSKQGNLDAVNSKVGEGSQQKSSQKTEERVQSHEQKQANPKQDRAAAAAATQTFNQWCGLCDVKLRSEIDLAAHLKGKRHSSNVTKMLESVMAKITS